MIKIILKIKLIDAFKNEKFINFDFEKESIMFIQMNEDVNYEIFLISDNIIFGENHSEIFYKLI
jgi:hypothetical protein